MDGERLATAEEAIRQIQERLDRQIGRIRTDLAAQREEIQQSRNECTNGLGDLREQVRSEFKDLRSASRAWITWAATAVIGVATVAVAVVALVVK